VTRAEAQVIIDAGGVLIDERVVAKSYRLHEGETVRITAAPMATGYPVAEPLAIDVEYVDDDVIVVYKPPGLVVHPGAGNDSGTLVNGLLEMFPEIAEVGDPSRPGIVHRLDKDTTGVMVVAKTEPALHSLSDQFKHRGVRKEYLALVHGAPRPAQRYETESESLMPNSLRNAAESTVHMLSDFVDDTVAAGSSVATSDL
jgi:23S rRNA pseudouridine1911/1915/1917 synthase